MTDHRQAAIEAISTFVTGNPQNPLGAKLIARIEPHLYAGFVERALSDEAIERMLAETNRQYPLLVNEIWARRVLAAALGVGKDNPE